MKIAVIGAGAVGGWFGGNLVRAGHDVVFVARGETLQEGPVVVALADAVYPAVAQGELHGFSIGDRRDPAVLLRDADVDAG